MINTNEFRKRLRIEIEGDPYVIVDTLFVKPGKGQAIYKTKIKNLITGKVIDKTFRSGETVGRPDLEEHDLQYLYNDGTEWVFMNNTTYEQISLTKDVLDETWKWLIDNLECVGLFFKGKLIAITPPNFVELKVTYSEPGLKGDTTTSPLKPATIETEAIIQVPLFVKEGDTVRIDTRTGEYVDRV